MRVLWSVIIDLSQYIIFELIGKKAAYMALKLVLLSDDVFLTQFLLNL